METDPSHNVQPGNADALDDTDKVMYLRFVAADAADDFEWPCGELAAHCSSKEKTKIKKVRRNRNARNIEKRERAPPPPPPPPPSDARGDASGSADQLGAPDSVAPGAPAADQVDS